MKMFASVWSTCCIGCFAACTVTSVGAGHLIAQQIRSVSSDDVLPTVENVPASSEGKRQRGVTLGRSSPFQNRIGLSAASVLSEPSQAADGSGDQFLSRQLPVKDSHAKLMQDLQRLMTILRDTHNDEQRRKASAAAETLMANYFDADLEARQQELARLNKRAKAMEETLAKRKSAKEELIELQMKSYQYDADGLGLFSERPTRSDSQRVGNLWWSAQTAPGALAQSFLSDPLTHVSESSVQSTTRSALNSAKAQIDQAIEELRKATSEELQDQATNNLREALGEYFDRDYEARQKELSEIFAGLDSMSQRIQRRAAARLEIIELQMELMLNEVQGLGFFRSESSPVARSRR